MANSFTKLWSSILDSSIWGEDDTTRIVWITLLAMKDEHGFVSASLDGIARRANVTVEKASRAIEILESPDQNSRSSNEDGRRIRRVDRGWHVINHDYYRGLVDSEARRIYERTRKAEYRARSMSGTSGTCEGHDRDTPGPERDPMHMHGSPSACSSSGEGEVQEREPAKRPKKPKAAVAKPDDVDQRHWDDWLAVRGSKPVTATALAGMVREADLAGVTLDDAIRIAAERGWVGFKADWNRTASAGGRGGYQQKRINDPAHVHDPTGKVKPWGEPGVYDL